MEYQTRHIDRNRQVPGLEGFIPIGSVECMNKKNKP